MNIINFNKWDSQPDAEVGQQNPLRWMNLKPVKENTYEPVSYWWMCKDFMNDAITAKWLGKTFKIYGFECDPKKFYSPGQKGMPCLLKGILPGFYDNMEMVNDKLEELGFPPIEVKKLEEDRVFINIPEEYLDNTLFISTVTLYIRLANCEGVHETLEECLSESVNRDSVKYYEATKKKPINKYPEKLKPYVWYYGAYNCPKDGSNTSFMTSTMHNCGVVNFTFET